MTSSSPFPLEGMSPWPSERAAAYRKAGYWRGETLGHWLAQRASAHPSRIGLVDVRRRATYAQLERESERLAGGLHALGLRRGDRVVLWLPNRIELFEMLLALVRLGVVPVLALPAHRRHELSAFARVTGARALITFDRHLGLESGRLAQTVCDQVEGLEMCIVGSADRSRAFELAGTREPLPAGPHPSDVALFQLSGGSTGNPKLIARTHDDYLYSVRASVEVCGWSESTAYLAALPAQHNFPLSSPGVLGALDVGGRAILSERPTPEEAFGWIESEAVTWTAVVPSILRVWLTAKSSSSRNLSSLEALQVGGAPLPEALARRVAPSLDCRLQQVFGMAEGLVCYTRLDEPEDLVVACQGLPMSPGDEICVVDDSDQPVASGQEGHLLVRGPYTVAGYYRDAAHQAHFTEDGFYRTGDRVRQLSSGHLVVAGRHKDQINRGGEKIAAPEVEAQLLAHPSIVDAALIALPDPYLGERSCAVVVGRGRLPPAAALRRFLRESGLAEYKLPDRFEGVDRLPRTAIGKLDKQTLALRFAIPPAVQPPGAP